MPTVYDFILNISGSKIILAKTKTKTKSNSLKLMVGNATLMNEVDNIVHGEDFTFQWDTTRKCWVFSDNEGVEFAHTSFEHNSAASHKESLRIRELEQGVVYVPTV